MAGVGRGTKKGRNQNSRLRWGLRKIERERERAVVVVAGTFLVGRIYLVRGYEVARAILRGEFFFFSFFLLLRVAGRRREEIFRRGAKLLQSGTLVAGKKKDFANARNGPFLLGF